MAGGSNTGGKDLCRQDVSGQVRTRIQYEEPENSKNQRKSSTKNKVTLKKSVFFCLSGGGGGHHQLPDDLLALQRIFANSWIDVTMGKAPSSFSENLAFE